MAHQKNLISQLVEQHRGLQKDLGAVAQELEKDAPSGEEIDKLLKRFTIDLTAHLELESNVFYAKLLEKMKEKGQDTAKTEQFIMEMDGIGRTVMVFLGKYHDSTSIDSQIADFRLEFGDIVNVLNLRIESEEAGVYAYWGLF